METRILIFGVPLILKLMTAMLQPNAHATDLLLHPVGRAAWVGLFATALNLLPVGPTRWRAHRALRQPARCIAGFRLLLPLALVPLGIFLWQGWLYLGRAF